MRLVMTRLVATCLLAAMGAAQGRVWIVDSQNRPGTHFTDLPAAVAAAADGDMIRVRDGAYTPPTITTGLTVLADAGATFLPTSTAMFIVRNLPAGRQVVLAGFVLARNLPSNSALLLADNQGPVLLDRLSVSNGGSNPTLTILTSRQVQINACTFASTSNTFISGPAMYVVYSFVAMSDTQVRGGAAVAGPGFPASVALVAQNADVTVSRGTLDGGAGTGVMPDMPAIQSTSASINLRGDGTTWVRAGQGRVGTVPAIVAYSGSVTLDPAVNLQSNNPGVPPISGAATVVTTWLPSLSARGVGPGGVVNADLFSPVADAALFLASLPDQPLDLGQAGRFWLDPGRFFVTGAGVVGATGHLPHAIPLPNDPNLSFGAWALQSLSGTSAGGWRLSNPVGFVLVN